MPSAEEHAIEQAVEFGVSFAAPSCACPCRAKRRRGPATEQADGERPGLRRQPIDQGRQHDPLARSSAAPTERPVEFDLAPDRGEQYGFRPGSIRRSVALGERSELPRRRRRTPTTHRLSAESPVLAGGPGTRGSSTIDSPPADAPGRRRVHSDGCSGPGLGGSRNSSRGVTRIVLGTRGRRDRPGRSCGARTSQRVGRLPQRGVRRGSVPRDGSGCPSGSTPASRVRIVDGPRRAGGRTRCDRRRRRRWAVDRRRGSSRGESLRRRRGAVCGPSVPRRVVSARSWNRVRRSAAPETRR